MPSYEIWIKNDPARFDGFVGDTRCTIRSRDGEWTPMERTSDRALVDWNLRDFHKCNPKIADHYEVREVSHV